MEATESRLESFMNGFEFVLLAIEGRVATEDMTPEARGRLQAFLDDYWRIAQAYRGRTHAPAPVLQIEDRVRAVLEPVMAN